MIKILLFSMMAVAAVLSVNAATETIDFSSLGYENAQKIAGVTQGDVVLTFSDGGTTIAPAYYNSGSALRMYASNTMTVALTYGYTITEIEFTLAGYDWKLGETSVYNVTPGVLTINELAANWSDINAESATFSVGTKEETGDNYQWRMVSMTVTYDESVVAKCSAPKFGLGEGTYYRTQEVELTCNTEGATIMYTINGGAEAEYTTPITLSEVGSYTISAYAKKDGIDNSDSVTATYEIAAPVEVSSLAEFQAKGESDGGSIMYMFTFPVTVTYQNASNLYVKDTEGNAMLIYGNQVPEYEVGDVIPAGIMGEYTNYSGLPEMQYPVVSTFVPSTQNVPTNPIAMKAGDISLSDLNKVVVVTGNVDETGKVVTDETGSLALYYQKAWNVETPVAGEYDVVCAVAVYNTVLQAYPIAFDKPSVNVAKVTVHFPDACADLLNGKTNVDLTTFEAEGFTFSFDKNGGMTNPIYYQHINTSTGEDEGSVRMYSQNSMTIVAPQGTIINAIDFTLADGIWNCGDDASAYPVSEGSFVFSYDDKTANWTGIANNEVNISVTANKNQAGGNPQLRVKSLIITYTGEVAKCFNPKFSLDEGTYYGAQEVGLTCNIEGATIMYSINDGTEAEYTTPIALSEVGSYTITAYAKKQGIDNSDEVTATYEIAAPAEVSSLAEFQAEGEAHGGNVVYEFTFPVTVTYQNASNLYVKDAEGNAMLIYGNQVPAYEVGDVIPAGIMGQYTNYNGLPEMQYPVAETFIPATQNVPTNPIAMKAGDISLSDLNKVVVVTGNVDETGKVVTDETGSLALYYQKAWNVETPVAGEYDVVCAVAVYNTGLQAYPIAFDNLGVSGVNDAVASIRTVFATANGITINAAAACTVVVYNAAGQAVEAVNVAAGESTVNVPAGFYIVKATDTVCKVLVK